MAERKAGWTETTEKPSPEPLLGSKWPPPESYSGGIRGLIRAARPGLSRRIERNRPVRLRQDFRPRGLSIPARRARRCAPGYRPARHSGSDRSSPDTTAPLFQRAAAEYLWEALPPPNLAKDPSMPAPYLRRLHSAPTRVSAERKPAAARTDSLPSVLARPPDSWRSVRAATADLPESRGRIRNSGSARASPAPQLTSVRAASDPSRGPMARLGYRHP